MNIPPMARGRFLVHLTAAMSEPLISIVMPLRNAATTLAETLDSIQAKLCRTLKSS